MRECIICHQLKDDDEFYQRKDKGTITSACIECIYNDTILDDHMAMLKWCYELDIPFSYDQFHKYYHYYYEQIPQCVNPTHKAIFYRYIEWTKGKNSQYKFNDTLLFNEYDEYIKLQELENRKLKSIEINKKVQELLDNN